MKYKYISIVSLPNLSSLAIFLLLSLDACSSSVTQLGDMMALVLRRPPTDYLHYGNWCGVGGDGASLDAIDSCCRAHDTCYAKGTHHSCPKTTGTDGQWVATTGRQQQQHNDNKNGDLVLSANVFMDDYEWGVLPEIGSGGQRIGQVVCGECDGKTTGA